MNIEVLDLDAIYPNSNSAQLSLANQARGLTHLVPTLTHLVPTLVDITDLNLGKARRLYHEHILSKISLINELIIKI